MDRDEVDPFLTLPFDLVEELVGAQALDAPPGTLDPHRDAVDRHGSHHHRGLGEDCAADLAQVTADRKVHDRVCPGVDAHLELGQLLAQVVMRRAGADVGVDLGGESFADAHRREPPLDVLRDHDPAARDPGADRLGRQPLVLGDGRHLGRQPPLPRVIELRHEAPPFQLKTKSHLGTTERRWPSCCAAGLFPPPVLTGSGSDGVLSARRECGHPYRPPITLVLFALPIKGFARPSLWASPTSDTRGPPTRGVR